MEQISERTIFSGFVTLKESVFKTNTGNLPYYSIHTRPLSVIVLAFDSKNRFLVTKEQRHAVGKTVYSLPGGLVEEGEDILKAAQRELREETGYDAQHFSVLGKCFPLPGLLVQTTTIVAARNIQKIAEPVLDELECISCEFCSMQEMKEILRTTTDIDAMSLAAFGCYALSTPDA
jgi:ADP-ribose pyrophosphatase